MADYGPSVKLCRLYEKTSAKGTKYLVGRLGGAKIAVLKDRQTAEDGSAIWNVVLSEAPAARQQADGEPTNAASRDWQAPRREAAPARSSDAPGDELIPF